MFMLHLFNEEQYTHFLFSTLTSNANRKKTINSKHGFFSHQNMDGWS